LNPSPPTEINPLLPLSFNGKWFFFLYIAGLSGVVPMFGKVLCFLRCGLTRHNGNLPVPASPGLPLQLDFEKRPQFPRILSGAARENDPAAIVTPAQKTAGHPTSPPLTSAFENGLPTGSCYVNPPFLPTRAGVLHVNHRWKHPCFSRRPCFFKQGFKASNFNHPKRS